LDRSRFAQIQSNQPTLLIGHIADDPAQWQRQFFDERRRGNDLFA
jgi:hypothetical protein